MRTLYIIGNGFDLHHGVPSRYDQFGKYLARTDRQIYDLVERYFAVDDGFWSAFEERLAYFDAYSLIDDAEDFLVSYAADDWSDSYHHDYQFEISTVVEALSAKMRARFGEWIRQLPLPSKMDIDATRLPLDSSAMFLNFNYTRTLQNLYGIAAPNVLHIHGSAADPADELVLGHGWDPSKKPSLNARIDPETEDIRVIQGNEIIDKYFRATFKPTAGIIQRNAAFFQSLADVGRISVLGHSLADVDLPYFEEIVRHVDGKRTNWLISYYGSPTFVETQAARLGLDPSRTTIAMLPQIAALSCGGDLAGSAGV